MEAAGALSAAASNLGSIQILPWGGHIYPRINLKPPFGCGLVLGWVWLSEGPTFRPNSNSAEFRAWVVLNYSSYVVLG